MTASSESGFLGWMFRSRETGRFTVVQLPSAPLAVFLVCRAAEWLLHPERAVSVVLRWTGTLAWWAVSEVLRGVNPFRRMLGAAVLVAVLIGTIGDVAGTAALGGLGRP